MRGVLFSIATATLTIATTTVTIATLTIATTTLTASHGGVAICQVHRVLWRVLQPRPKHMPATIRRNVQRQRNGWSSLRRKLLLH